MTVFLEVVYDIGSLAFVGSYYSDLFGSDSCALEIKDYFVDCYCLGSVQIGRS